MMKKDEKNMNISDVKTANKIASAYLKTKHIQKGRNKGKVSSLWSLDWSIDKDLQKDDRGRVYILVSDGKIMKLGGSQGKGGIKSTMSFYITALSGSPSLRSFGIHKHIAEELSKGRKVDVYCLWGPKTISKVPGLFESTSMDVSPFKEMERNCVNDYKLNNDGRLPKWNYQENGEKWPSKIRDEYDYVKNGK
tara:strand:- start:1012 stop:1590 length:579 start_codon:yes stop_codon:yes gene_type:complete